MAYKSFQEYLTGKSGKMQNTGKIQQIADYSGPVDTKPEKEKKHKDAGGVGQNGEIKSYAGGTNAKDPNKGKLGDGFSSKGDNSLKYTPGKGEKSSKAAGIPGGKEVASAWPKTKTQEWIDKTKDMSLAEFTKLMQQTTTKGLDECACQNIPNALEVVKQTVTLTNANESVMASLVREMKRSKSFDKLVAELLQHEETYGIVAKFMEKDERYARRLVRAMNEMVGPPAHKGQLPDENEDPDKPPHPEDMHGSDDDDMGMGDDDDMDMGDEEDDLDMDGSGVDAPEGDDMGDEGHPESDIAPGSKIMPQKKKKKLHAHNHLMNAMKDHPAMAQDMGGMGQMGGGSGGIV